MSFRSLRGLGVTVLLLASLCHVCLARAAITVVTEELPPYNMTLDGKLTGIGTELVEAVMAEAGEAARIQSMPWARAYDTALNSPNVLIYSIARTPQRARRCSSGSESSRRHVGSSSRFPVRNSS